MCVWCVMCDVLGCLCGWVFLTYCKFISLSQHEVGGFQVAMSHSLLLMQITKSKCQLCVENSHWEDGGGESERERGREGERGRERERERKREREREGEREMDLCEYPPDSFFFKSLPFFSQRCNVVTKGSPFNHFHDDVKMAPLLKTFVIMDYIRVVQLL